MKPVIITLLFIAIINVAHAQQYAYHPKYAVVLNADKGKKCMHQCSRPVPENIDDFYTVTSADSMLLVQNLKKVLSLKAPYGGKPGNLDDYCFQLMGVVSGKQKFIYINAFQAYEISLIRSVTRLWKTDPIIVCGGGSGAWGALFDPAQQTFSQLSFNGRM